MHDPDLNAPPFNPLPWVVTVLSVVIGGIELIFQLAEAGLLAKGQSVGLRISLVEQFAFSDPLFDRMRAIGTYPPEHMMRIISYVFFHRDLIHTIFALVFILAIGKFVAEILHPVAVLAIFFMSAGVGAILYSLFINENMILIGAYPAVYGLIGAFTWLRFSDLKEIGESGLQAFSLIFFLMIISLVYKLLFGGTEEWVADLMGFATGFVISGFISPGGKDRLQMFLQKMRKR